MKKTDTEKRYYSRVPRKPKAGCVLVHNHIRHTVDMPSGVNGFRFWTQERSAAVVPCKCGWKGVPHYRVKGKGGSERCEPGSWRALQKPPRP